MRANKQILAVTLIVLTTTLIAACGGGATGGDSQAAANGKKLFESGGAAGVPCATCHTLDGTELVGPSMQGINERAGSQVDGLSAEEYLHQSIVDPSAYVVEGYDNTMFSSYGDLLSEDDINDLVAYLQSLD